MPFSVITIAWLWEHRAFIVECFIKIESYMAVQHAFCRKFKLEKKTCLFHWVSQLASRWKDFAKQVQQHQLQTVESCEKQWAAVKVAPQTSLCQHTSLLHFSLSTAHRMLKHDLGYHLYKLQIAQELKKTNSAIWKDIFKHFSHLQLPEDIELFFLATRHIFNWIGCVNE